MVIQTGVFSEWTNDSQRFLLEHFDTICGSPSHIYHSALPLSPSSSWLKRCYSVELTQVVRVVKGFDAGWGAYSRTVVLEHDLNSLSCWNNFVAVGSDSGEVIILDATTGSQTAVLSGHTDYVMSVAFSSDGTLLASGSDDRTVRLWDVQTGGVIKTFLHTNQVSSVSISVGCSMVASGTDSGVHLWDIHTGESKCVILRENKVDCVIFSPKNPQHLVSIYDGKIQQWNVNGHEIGPTYSGFHISFSSDHTQFALCNGQVVTVQSSDSGAVVAEFQVDDTTMNCCFSPDSRLIAAAAGYTVYIWDIISTEPHLVESFVGHARRISSLAFLSPSTLISSAWDKSVKFWQIGISPTDSVITKQKSTSSALASPNSVSLQVKDGIAISSDSYGVVKIWDILTGLCKVSFQTPTQNYICSDAYLRKDGLIFIWGDEEGIHFWNSNEDKTKTKVLSITENIVGLRISQDGSKVFCLTASTITLWSIWEWECVGEVRHGVTAPYLHPLQTGHSKIWIGSGGSNKGWNFGVLGSPPVPLLNTFTGEAHPVLICDSLWKWGGVTGIRARGTERGVFQLSGGYADPKNMQWDGQYFVAGYDSGEVLILDFHYLNAK